MRTYHLFISHSWNYSDQYERLKNLLDRDPYFHYRDYSVPWYKPIRGVKNDRQLENALYDKMYHASCVLILAGVYSTYSDWIRAEIDMALDLGKKIIAVEPWGAERTSAVVKDAADIIVGWNSRDIIDAIRYG